jgi:ketosteroid isomerase-like protein
VEPRDNQDSRHVVKAFLEAFEKMDHAAIVSCFDDNAVLVIPFDVDGEPDPWFTFTGHSEIAGYWNNAVTTLSRISLTSPLLTVSDDGSTVFCEAVGDMILAANGDEYRNIYVFKFVVENSKIVRLLEYANPVVAAKLGGGDAIAGLEELTS